MKGKKLTVKVEIIQVILTGTVQPPPPNGLGFLRFLKSCKFPHE